MVEKLKESPSSPTPIVKTPKAAPVKMLGTIKKCSGNCKSPFQDQLYGKGMRAMNPMGTRSGAGSYRCTVCSTTN